MTSRFGEPRRVESLALCLALTGLAYVAAMLLTNASFTGDSSDYARASAARLLGVNCDFLEFGHLAWRPLGTLMLDLFEPPRGGLNYALLSYHALRQLSSAAWICGLVGTLAAFAWLHNSLRSFSAAAFGVAFLLSSKAYLNYSHVGTPYVPGLSALLAGLFIASFEAERPVSRVACDLAAGVLFGVSALLWGTFALALPGAVLARFVLKGDGLRGFPRVLRTGAAGVITLAGVYFSVGKALGFESAADYRAWVAASSHGLSTGGLPRAVIGFARSLIDLGDFGRLARRHLTHDPFNPVSASELLSVDLAKMTGVYLMMLALATAATLTTVGRRALAVAALMTLPVFVFAVAWQGGDLERYLPAMPALVLLAAAAFQAAEGHPVLRSVIVAGVAVVATANLLALSNAALRRQDNIAVSRLAGLEDVPLDRSLFVVSHWQDELMTLHRDRPFHKLNLEGLTVYSLVTPGSVGTAIWKEMLAAQILRSWTQGRRVFISSRLFAAKPEVSWNWIETADEHVSWPDFPAFLDGFGFAPPAAPNAEFRELLPTERNRNALAGIAVATAGDATTRLPPSLVSTGACTVDQR
jgi:hypothetical protein